MSLESIFMVLYCGCLIWSVCGAGRRAVHKHVVKPRWYRRFQQELEIIDADVAPMDSPFLLMEGFSARFIPVTEHFLLGDCKPGTHALLLQVSADQDDVAFPFTAVYHRGSYAPGKTFSDPDTLDFRCKVDGDKLAFYAVLDPPIRVFLDRHDFAVSKKQFKIILIHSEADSFEKMGRLAADLPDLLDQVRQVLKRLTCATTAADFIQRLTAAEPQNLRHQALTTWLQRPRQQPAPRFYLPAGDSADTRELLWVRLDLGGPLEAAEWDKLWAEESEDPKALTEYSFCSNLKLLLKHQSEQRRYQTVLKLIDRRDTHASVATVLSEFRDPIFNDILTEIYRQNPDNSIPLCALTVPGHPEVLTFLIDVLRNGPLDAQETAASLLATDGDHAALCALAEVRVGLNRKHRREFDEAYLRLRQKLGPRRNAGALSSVEPDPNSGALSQADQFSGAPSAPTPTPPKNRP